MTLKVPFYKMAFYTIYYQWFDHLAFDYILFHRKYPGVENRYISLGFWTTLYNFSFSFISFTCLFHRFFLFLSSTGTLIKSAVLCKLISALVQYRWSINHIYYAYENIRKTRSQTELCIDRWIVSLFLKINFKTYTTKKI